VFLAASVLAQDDEILASGGKPLENQIVDRELAVRLRLEARGTQDSEGLVDEAPALRFSPQQMYAGELKLFHSSRATLAGSYEYWLNDQDMQDRRLGAALGVPLGESWIARVRFFNLDQTDVGTYRFYYAGAGGMLGKVYSFSQYRYETPATGSTNLHQVYQYFSFTAGNRFRGGAKGAYEIDDAGARRSWYTGGFGSLALLQDWTTLRYEGLVGEYTGFRHYQEHRVYLYQRVGSRLLVRPEYRYYRDNQDVDSNAYGIKLIYYFSPAVDFHVGYRRYTQSEGAGLNTVMAGLGIIF
jgi:hypothetical protein